jgi:hypothetical protein
MGRRPAGGAWRRRIGAIAVAIVAMTTVVVRSSSAETVGDGPFLVTNATLTWGCGPQAVYIDRAGAPSAWHVQEVQRALRRFRTATGRPWPETDDPDAPVHIRWYDPAGHGGALTVMGADDTNYLGADVQLSPAIRDEWFFSTVLHELGHVAGLAHVSDQTEVMGLYPSSPHERYEVGDLVGMRVLDRTCSLAAARASASGRRG